MPIMCVGFNHKTALLAIRERMAFLPKQIPSALNSITEVTNANEALILSTCNRTEIYTDTTDFDKVLLWLSEQAQMAVDVVRPLLYQYTDTEALNHILRVAAGLDSMMLGEPEILGQVKQAYHIAAKANTLGPVLSMVFPFVFATTKKIRTETDIGRNPVSLPYAVIQLMQRLFSDLEQCRVLLIGAGKATEMMAKYLQTHTVKELLIANRSIAAAQKLADVYGATVIEMNGVAACLDQVDVLITATTSPEPILFKNMLSTLAPLRAQRPLLIVDLAVPRDIDVQVSSLKNVYLFNVDDMQQVIDNSVAARQVAAVEAENMIQVALEEHMQNTRIRDAGALIKSLRDKYHDESDVILKKALAQLNNGVDAREVMRTLTHNLNQLFLHRPTQCIRDAAYNEQWDMLKWLRDLYGMS